MELLEEKYQQSSVVFITGSEGFCFYYRLVQLQLQS